MSSVETGQMSAVKARHMSIILRATPTAAGPSSSKRSVLWRTRGFAALGFDCCVVAGAVSGMSGACLV